MQESVSAPQEHGHRLGRLWWSPGSRTQRLPFSCGRWFVPWLGTMAVQPLAPTLGHVALLQQLTNGWVSPERELDRPSLKDCLKRYGPPRWGGGKGPPANAGDAGDVGSIPGGRRSPKNGNPCQYFCLKSPIDRGQATVRGVAKESDTTG